MDLGGQLSCRKQVLQLRALLIHPVTLLVLAIIQEAWVAANSDDNNSENRRIWLNAVLGYRSRI